MRKILDLPERICACGCNRQFKPTRGNQRFFEAACRKKFHAEEMVAVRLTLLKQIVALTLSASDWGMNLDIPALDDEAMAVNEAIFADTRLKAVLEKK